MSIAVITPPAFEPITLEAARLHCRVDVLPGSPTGHPDDPFILRAITAAREVAEEILRRALVQQGLRMHLPGWPGACHRTGRQRATVDLLRPPLISVDSITYYDEDNVLQTVDPASYFVEPLEPVARVRFVTGYSWPATYERADAVRIDYTAGYAPAASPALTQEEISATIPASIIAAMLLMIGDQYEHRETYVLGSIVSTIPAVGALLDGKRVHNF